MKSYVEHNYLKPPFSNEGGESLKSSSHTVGRENLKSLVNFLD
jgi:hypothetical protein